MDEREVGEVEEVVHHPPRPRPRHTSTGVLIRRYAGIVVFEDLRQVCRVAAGAEPDEPVPVGNLERLEWALGGTAVPSGRRRARARSGRRRRTASRGTGTRCNRRSPCRATAASRRGARRRWSDGARGDVPRPPSLLGTARRSTASGCPRVGRPATGRPDPASRREQPKRQRQPVPTNRRSDHQSSPSLLLSVAWRTRTR